MEERNPSLHSPRLTSNEESGRQSLEGDLKRKLKEEVKKQLWLAGPLIGVSILHYALQVISVMFVGHLGELALASASLAASFANVTGFSLLLGMGSALDTLCGQAYGAEQYHMLGIYMQRAVFINLVTGVPISFIWAYMGRILMCLRQDHEISMKAEQYARWMIPSVFAYGVLQCQIKFLQSQNIVFPMMISSGITTLVHILVCWLLVFKSGLGIKGAALSNAISYWINVFLLIFYTKFSPSCKKTWIGLSKEAFHDVIKFLRLAIPSAFMVCLEYWSFELVVLLSGLLPNPKLEMSVLSISVNTMWIVYMVPFGLSSALRVWGHLYSNEKEVVKYIASMMPVLAVSNFVDGIQCVLSGAARGCGRQKTCAFVNLGSFYVVGIPCAALFAFNIHLRGKGLWIGIICGLTVQVLLLLIITICTNWEKEARKARDRVMTPAAIQMAT